MLLVVVKNDSGLQGLGRMNVQLVDMVRVEYEVREQGLNIREKHI